MLEHIGLRARVYVILSILFFVTLAGGIVMVWYTFRIDAMLNSVLNTHIASYQVAESLEKALINQKGFVSYYFIDGDPEWLRELGEHRQIFKERIKNALAISKNNSTERQVLEKINSEYTNYVKIKDQVINLYTQGDRKTGAEVHKKTRVLYFKLLDLCDKYKQIHTVKIQDIKSKTYAEATQLRFMAVSGVILVLFFSLLLLLVLTYQILIPVRKLISETTTMNGTVTQKDEVQALSMGVHKLIVDSNHIQTELQRSRENLMQAEKMAMVGKLAAGMAHTIRNPMTSVKMRLFSLNRSIELSNTQKEDFDVISDEIRHIDTIVQNFLEFSRPPKLVIQSISPSVVVDLAIQLLTHRLKSYDVDVSVQRQAALPEIQADPEQLKEVLVNIIVNACEAIGSRGSIVITEEESEEASGRVAVIKLRDTGPGLSEEIKEKIFQPFFTTKDEGTGLGLSIVFRIIEEHGGWIDVTSAEGEGTTFTIKLPIKEPGSGNNINH